MYGQKNTLVSGNEGDEKNLHPAKLKQIAWGIKGYFKNADLIYLLSAILVSQCVYLYLCEKQHKSNFGTTICAQETNLSQITALKSIQLA